MLILHAHWQPPLAPAETGGILVWAETGNAQPPAWQRGRLAQNPRPKSHPFYASISELRASINRTGKESAAVLRLPTTRTGPLPSPELPHAWDLDMARPPVLAPWIVHGIWMTPAEAALALLDLSASRQESAARFGPAASLRFWGRAAALALETLAAHKILPLLVPVDAEEKTFHARWLPVLDSPGMPSGCRSRKPPCRPSAARRFLMKGEPHLREAC
jgi:hypothetical protein